MRISSIVVGELDENCYLLENGHDCLLIDPGEDLKKILHFIHGKNIKGILITHRHHDHIGSLDDLVKRFSYPVYEFSNLNEGIMKIESFVIEVIFTPGHTPDSVCYYFRNEKIMITGDFLFCGTIGRCDLVGGDYFSMLDSIHKISKYDDDIVIYPGHGCKSILGNEKRYNPYFKEV